ncbi:recombinase family protein [Frigoribacterium sp. UYMn621]|uniref:recombinase family protein n=1 Tax=Frigoribacterium sp. UYMn621 TaxID=3156343 RepID=UPI00339A5853
MSALVQNTVRQLDQIPVDNTYIEKASGKDQTNRTELEALIRFAREGDSLLIHSMDRLARNLDDLKKIIGRCSRKGVRVEFAKEALTSTGDDNAAAFLLHVIKEFAEFERPSLVSGSGRIARPNNGRSIQALHRRSSLRRLRSCVEKPARER